MFLLIFSYRFYQQLLEYLVNFWKRTHPITPTKAILKKCEIVFNDDWKDNAVEGWQKPWTKATKQKFSKSVNLLSELKLTEKKKKKKKKEKKSEKKEKDDDDENEDDDDNEDDDIDMKQDKDGDNDEDENEDDDIDINLSLKYNHGLYCFACVRKFNNLNTMINGHFKSKKHLQKKKIALLEYKLLLFADLLTESILGAVEYIEKKQTKTYDEIRLELEEAEKEDDDYYDEYGGLNNNNDNNNNKYDSDDMEDDPSILNPLQIPLDFDGKPIPYWLYKFRGLNRYFDCEICDTRYRGPRAFERHFREWKHAHCMRILNIPNTKDFHMITNRKDAQLLNQKIQNAKLNKSWNPEREEEFEDNEGNVFKKSMYDQLKRQGVV